jgi:phage shock protein C
LRVRGTSRGRQYRRNLDLVRGVFSIEPMKHRLYRSRRRKVIAGVCGGIAERLSVSPLVVRALFVLGAFLPVLPGVVVYLVLWIVLPKESASLRAGQVASGV